MISIYVDDDLENRATPKGFNRVFNSDEFMFLINNNTEPIDTISFDNDLGLNSLEGYQLVNKVVELGISVRYINLHSSNVVAVKSTYQMLKRCQELGIINLQKLTAIPAVKFVEEYD